MCFTNIYKMAPLFRVTKAKVLSLLMIVTTFTCLYIHDPKLNTMQHYLTKKSNQMEAFGKISSPKDQLGVHEQYMDSTTKIIHLWGQIRQKFFNFTGCPYKCEFIKAMEYQKQADLVLISVHKMP